MHKFIVNNRIRSDPPQLLHNGSTSTATTTAATIKQINNNMNAILKLKMALPSPTTTSAVAHLIDVGGADTNNNNKNNNNHHGARINSSSSSDCTHSSQSSRGSSSNRDVKRERTSEGKAETPAPPNTIRMSGYLKKKRNVSILVLSKRNSGVGGGGGCHQLLFPRQLSWSTVPTHLQTPTDRPQEATKVQTERQLVIYTSTLNIIISLN